MTSTNTVSTTRYMGHNDLRADMYPIADNTCDDCPVCLESLSSEEARILPCNHVFHTTCLDQMIKCGITGSSSQPTCGLCRSNIEPPINHDELPRFTKLIDRVHGEHKHYQYNGISWCIQQEKTHSRAILLADEMGLGKTFTIIGTMIENFMQRTLIVVPVALIQQWKEQIKRLTGHDCVVFHGQQRNKYTTQTLSQYPVVLTTYGQIAMNLKKPSADNILYDISWNRVVFDEAHHLRNSRTGRYHGANKLSANTRWFVTGTPVQNTPRDIQAIALLAGIPTNDLIQYHMLRRTKQGVGLSLPSLIFHTENVEWSNEQEKALAEEIHAKLPNNPIHSSFNGTFTDHIADHPLLALIRARQMCTFPATMGSSVRQLVQDGDIDPANPGIQGLLGSSKLNAVLQKITSRSNNGAKKIVFCTFHREMNFLKNKLTQENIHTQIYNEKNKNTNTPDVLILQVQTCCEGLNLQEYSEVYFVTPHWNPFVEKQAIARCHRMGQTQSVHVFQFIMNSHEFNGSQNEDAEPYTFDTLVQYMQEEKCHIADQVLGGEYTL